MSVLCVCVCVCVRVCVCRGGDGGYAEVYTDGDMCEGVVSAGSWVARLFNFIAFELEL